MALHKDFPKAPHAILNPDIRWFPADEALRESSYEIHIRLRRTKDNENNPPSPHFGKGGYRGIFR